MQLGNHIHVKTLLTLGLLITMVLTGVSQAGPTERRQAKRIHDRVVGVPPTNAVLDAMETDLIANGGESAARIAMRNPAFYNITLKNLVTPWTNEEQNSFAPLNDYTTTVIGIVMNDTDFREVLYGNYLYKGKTTLGLTTPNYSSTDNDHYSTVGVDSSDAKFDDITLESVGVASWNGTQTDFVSNIEQITQTSALGIPDEATAGVMTSRAAARAFFLDGTNRAMFRFTLLNHFCDDLEQVKDVTRTPDRIHQDVSRSPGGDSRIFMNACLGCHAGMDGMMGAFAYYQWSYPGMDQEDAGQLAYTGPNGSVQNVPDPNPTPISDPNYAPGSTLQPPSVQLKFLINENNFNAGYVTTDDSWVNYWRNGQNSLMGWDANCPQGTNGVGAVDGKGNCRSSGAKNLGRELANTNAFAQCQVKKVFKAVCLRDSDDYAADRAQVNTITTNFKNNGYKLKDVFAATADYCKGD